MENSNLETATVNPMPRIGDIAPDFEAVTTKGKIKDTVNAQSEQFSVHSVKFTFSLCKPTHLCSTYRSKICWV